MLKKIFILFVIIWVCCGISAPMYTFDKAMENYNAFDIFSLISFLVLVGGVIIYILSGFAIKLYFKLKR